jgi:hypothetical protein
LQYYNTILFSGEPEEFYSLIIDERVYDFRKLWNTLGFWTLSVMDANKKEIVNGVKLVSGVFIFKQYSQIDFDLIFDYKKDPERDTLKNMIAKVYIK